MGALPQPAADEDPHVLARAFVEADDEMPAAMAWAARRGLQLVYDPVELTVSLALRGPADADGEVEAYLLHGSFDGYRLLPPIWKFMHPITGADVGLCAYPRPTGASVLHSGGLICAHWSRMAYSQHGGPHGNWGAPTAWQQPVEGTVALTIPDMLDRLGREVQDSRGRMAVLPA